LNSNWGRELYIKDKAGGVLRSGGYEEKTATRCDDEPVKQQNGVRRENKSERKRRSSQRLA
jgi:hypothetical protein